MINNILKILQDVSVTKTTGQLFADKSYKYDTVFFLSKFIISNLDAELCFQSKTYEENAIEYTKDIFNLELKSKEDAQKIKNYLSETLTILQFANVISKIRDNVYKVRELEILEYIIKCPENSYIFLYLVAYQTLKNDNMLELYRLFINSTIEKKKDLIKKFESYIKSAPSIDKWAPFKTKFLLMVLGFANGDLEIARTLNVKNAPISIESISINVKGTRTPDYLPKKNDYILKFNKNYVLKELQSYLLKPQTINNNVDIISPLATELADLKIDILKSRHVIRQKESFEQEQFIETTIKSRNHNIQRIFKDNLLKTLKHVCPICGFEYEDFLIASHIKPYSKCDDTYDAINCFNGLLMCPNHDKLFEGAKLMTIDVGSNRIILSEKAKHSKDFAELDGKVIDKSLIDCERRHYLKWHNEQFKLLNK